MSHFKSTRRGIVADFSPAERMVLMDVVPLLESIGRAGDDPAATRLGVPVYLDNPDANDEWWRLMGPDLDEGREKDRAAFKAMVESAHTTILSDSDADAILRVLNEARLAVGARLGIEVEADHENMSMEERQALDYLGWIQEELMVELSRRL